MAKEKTTKKDDNEKAENKNKVTLPIVLYIVISIMAGFLLGFYSGTKYGVSSSQAVIEELIRESNLDIEEVDLSEFSAVPAASYAGTAKTEPIRFFVDLQDPESVTMLSETVKPVIEEGKYSVEIYDFPSDNNSYALIAASYARCAAENGVNYTNYISTLISDFSEWTSLKKETNVTEYLLNLTVMNGADEEDMNLCVISGDVQSEITESQTKAEELGVEKAPAFIIGDTLFNNYVEKETFVKLFAKYGK